MVRTMKENKSVVWTAGTVGALVISLWAFNINLFDVRMVPDHEKRLIRLEQTIENAELLETLKELDRAVRHNATLDSVIIAQLKELKQEVRELQR